VSLILAGAIGNIIDCVFYGEIFSESTHSTIAQFVPIGDGYSDWFYGKVVDMFYFPLIETNWPEWMPFVGGEHFIFFSPIFNFADAAISCGIIALILFYGKYLGDIMENHK
jgi:signal peptidase II